ncbi:MAG: GTPase ObgE [SAR202 cluster bacterium]|nr:GTPase ObgE [SAR202 cluster bacterium]
MIDKARIRVSSGKGGNGSVSFRREKFVPKGGPDGGEGGEGGSVYIRGDASLNTLIDFRYRSIYKAGDGGHGRGQNKTGAHGADLTIRVPIGTVVSVLEEGIERPALDVLDEERVLLVRGGKGGRGNIRFATSVNQTPMLAEAGEDGQEFELTLELKLLADVGIVGMPNAGKSTLIGVCSAAKPKIADYPFTTLEPVLGVAEYKGMRFLLMEVPGLIEGAHTGTGLGHDFLRHAERTRLLWHLVDGSAPDVEGRVDVINQELQHFGSELAEKPQILVVNKMDTAEAQESLESVKRVVESLGVRAFYISAAGRQGLEPLLAHTAEALASMPRALAGETALRGELPLRRPPKGAAEVHKEAGTFVVDSPRAIRLAAMANMRDRWARLQLWKEMEKMGVVEALERAGVKEGDTVRVGLIEMEWQ